MFPFVFNFVDKWKHGEDDYVPAAALLRDMPLYAIHMASFVRHVGGASELDGLSSPPVRQAADKHFHTDK